MARKHKPEGHCQSKHTSWAKTPHGISLRDAAPHKALQSVPLFQLFNRDEPSGRDDVSAVPAVAS